jgi:hypothetical protein
MVAENFVAQQQSKQRLLEIREKQLFVVNTKEC